MKLPDEMPIPVPRQLLLPPVLAEGLVHHGLAVDHLRPIEGDHHLLLEPLLGDGARTANQRILRNPLSAIERILSGF